MKIELIVGLKIPDNVAITAYHTLHRMGYHHLKNLERFEYYSFETSGDEKSFKKKISETDILINANKHSFEFGIEIEDDKTYVLTEDDSLQSKLLEKLKGLGFKNLKKVRKGVLWKMHFDTEIDAKKRAEDITKELLVNEHYQKFKLL